MAVVGATSMSESLRSESEPLASESEPLRSGSEAWNREAPASEILSGADLSCRSWRAPDVEHFSGAGAPTVLTAERMEELENQVRSAAREAGREEGLRAGQAEAARQAQRIAALADAVVEPLARIDEAVGRELIELAMALARQIIRRELSLHPDEVVPVVREALAALPAGSSNARIRLHPDDRRLVESALSLDDVDGVNAGDAVNAVNLESSTGRFTDDPTLSRGDCVVQEGQSIVDARLATRIAALFAANFGDAREGERA